MSPTTLSSRMKHRIAQKAPKNASVPKKHGKCKQSTLQLSCILQHLQNNAGHSGSDQSDSAQSDSERSTTNTPEDNSAHFEGTGGPLATAAELGLNVNDQIQISLEPQLLTTPEVGNTRHEGLPVPLLSATDVSYPTPVAIPLGVSMQVVANFTIPPEAGQHDTPDDMILDANNGVATAEVNALVGDLVENRKRDVHTQVVGEKRKERKTSMEPSVKTTLQKTPPPPEYIWCVGMPVVKQYHTESR